MLNTQSILFVISSFVLSVPGLGLFSSPMREQANISHTGPKWIVLDGDIDPMWIESLDAVMDENKVPPSCSLIKPMSTWGSIGEQMVYFLILQELLLECDLREVFAEAKVSQWLCVWNSLNQ